jgi:putative nucleotidyltransferase-like protein
MHSIAGIHPASDSAAVPSAATLNDASPVVPTAVGHAADLDLLLLSARTVSSTADRARIDALLRVEIDWDFLIGTAHRHRVLPLVYRSLARLPASAVPESALARLRTAFHANARRNLYLTRELFQVMDLLHAHDIASIPYKGPALAGRLYGDISLRQYADLDIIVPVKDVVRARALLMAAGYRPEKPMSDEQLRRFMVGEKDITLLHEKRGINLEIHWGVTTAEDPFRIPHDSLWSNLETCRVAGRVVRALGPEDLLLVLCVHGAKHRWERLGWLCDVAEIVRCPGMVNWDRALDSAARLGGKRILFLGLTLARELLGAEPAAAVVRAMTVDPVLPSLVHEVKGWIFSEQPVELDLGERERYFMRLREHPTDRFRVALRQARCYLALTAEDTKVEWLPKSLMWSLYLLRPFRLAGQYGLTPFARFLKGIFQS